MQCNIDAKGKAVRLVWGLVILLASGVVAVLLLAGAMAGWYWWVGVGLGVLAGGFGVFEARAGWCVVRAMGFKTPV